MSAINLVLCEPMSSTNIRQNLTSNDHLLQDGTDSMNKDSKLSALSTTHLKNTHQYYTPHKCSTLKYMHAHIDTYLNPSDKESSTVREEHAVGG